MRRAAVLAGTACLLVGCAAPAHQGSRGAPASAATAPAAQAPSVAEAPPAGGGPPTQSPPAEVLLEAAGARGDVVLSPVAPDGSLAVPDDVSLLGWWVGSTPMGADAGTTLVAGHVDSAEMGLGLFAELRDLEPGDAVSVVDGLGEEHPFEVTAVEEVHKSDLPDALFATSGPRLLALVTCSGPFDEETRHYRDNLVVWAEPA